MAMNIADYLIVRDRVAGNDGQIHTPCRSEAAG